MRNTIAARLMIGVLLVAIASGTLAAQRHGGHMQGAGPGAAPDMRLIHFLIEHRDAITRTVTRLPNGVETVTESADADVAAGIREHVAAMARRVETGAPIHLRDPLFREIFAHARKITVHQTPTDRGVRVVETSEEPYVARLIQAHADVVSLFIENGHAEMMRNHPVPSGDPAAK